MSRSGRTGAAAPLALAAVAGFFLFGAASHGYDLVVRGPVPYPAVGTPINLFWTCLLVVDLVVAGLLVLRRRAGLLLGAVVLVLDVPANAYAVLTVQDVPWPEAGGLLRLAAFTLGYLALCPMLWRYLSRKPSRTAAG